MFKKFLALIFAAALAACNNNSVSESSTPPQTIAPAEATPETPSAPIAKDSDDISPEMLDSATIITTLQKTGMAEGERKEAEWNQRLAAAKNNADIQAVLSEQLNLYRTVEQALLGVEMQSERGKAIHRKMLDSLRQVCVILERGQQLDFENPKDMARANQMMPEMSQAVMAFAQSFQELMNMMKDSGININQAAEAHVNKKMQQIKEMTQ